MALATLAFWVYIVLLVVGGLIGFLKAGSRIALITSAGFAAALVLCETGILRIPYGVEILLGVLLVFFAVKFTKNKKFMPSGLLMILTILLLVVRRLL